MSGSDLVFWREATLLASCGLEIFVFADVMFAVMGTAE